MAEIHISVGGDLNRLLMVGILLTIVGLMSHPPLNIQLREVSSLLLITRRVGYFWLLVVLASLVSPFSMHSLSAIKGVVLASLLVVVLPYLITKESQLTMTYTGICLGAYFMHLSLLDHILRASELNPGTMVRFSQSITAVGGLDSSTLFSICTLPFMCYLFRRMRGLSKVLSAFLYFCTLGLALLFLRLDLVVMSLLVQGVILIWEKEGTRFGGTLQNLMRKYQLTMGIVAIVSLFVLIAGVTYLLPPLPLISDVVASETGFSKLSFAHIKDVKAVMVNFAFSGVGLGGASEQFILPEFTGKELSESSAGNFYLFWLLRTGFVGLLALWQLVILIGRGIRTKLGFNQGKGMERREISMPWLTSIIVFAISCGYSNPWSNEACMILFWLLIAMMLSAMKLDHENSFV